MRNIAFTVIAPLFAAVTNALILGAQMGVTF
jgi:hypothetical protein